MSAVQCVLAAVLALFSTAHGGCCSTHSASVPMNTSVDADIGCSGAKSLDFWNPEINHEATHHWLQGDGPTWLSFAGDSEVRYEFWTLVRMIGKHDFTASSNFATVAFNASDPGTMKKMLADGDPVTVEAKYMDYRFCCASPSRPSSCHIETGGDNVTKLHAGYRKVNYWVSKYTDFTDLGTATSDFLERNPSGLCITWKMVAYPIPEVIYPLLGSQLDQRVPPTALVLNPGLHHLCFKGNKRGSEGHIAHLNGFQLFKDLLNARKEAGKLNTKIIMHNVLWANEQGLYDAYAARNIMDKAMTFRGLQAGITNWNKDAKDVLGSKPPMELLDLYTLSKKLKGLIKKDHVHFMPPMYEAALAFDINIMFGNVEMCHEF